jgi:excisionase family DNA binding protein
MSDRKTHHYLTLQEVLQQSGLSETQPSYVDVKELSARAGISATTIHRLKRQGKIPFYQPAGKGGRVLFPADAIERACLTPTSSGPGRSGSVNQGQERLSGPCPAWMQASASQDKDCKNAT